ncbi:MAG: family 10 glycosylhydrolase [Gemmatimonadota bacterium]
MHKREFLKLAGMAAAGMASGCAPAWRRSPARVPQARPKHWTWFGPSEGTGDDEWRRTFATMRASGIDAVLPEVVNTHEAHYASQHLPVAEPWLERILPMAHAEGLEVHAWMHTMTCNIPAVYEAHREWYSVNGLDESSADKPAYVDYYKFLCPSRPEVQEFVARRVRELAAIDELDGVHLDYIRYPDVILAPALQPRYRIVQDREYPQYDYCYCEVCRRDFREQTGVDPKDLADPSADAAWRQFRYDRITRLVNRVLVPEGRRRGKAMTAAVFPNWENVRQNWYRWDVDAVLPMLYHRFYNEEIEWIGRQCARGVANLPGEVRLYSGVQVPRRAPEQLAQMVQVSMAGGAAGVSLFSARSMSEELWKVFAAAVQQID